MKDEIKLIASDLDGTLLRNGKTLSPYTLSVLERCRSCGIIFLAATARPPRALEAVIPGLDYDGAICHNGGVAVLHGKVIWEQGITSQTAAALAQRILEQLPGARLSAEIAGELYANFDAASIWPGCPYWETDFSSLPDKPAEKLIVEVESKEQVRSLERLLPEELYPQVSENRVVMIQPKGVEKGKALLELCRRLSISPAQTVGFGDDFNDISLLDACGTGVAVENALSEVKAASDCVCLSNEEDGPAHWLEQHLLHTKGATI